MVRHYYVSEQKKTAGSSSFVDCFAGNYLDGVGLKDRQAVLCYRRDEKTWIIFRDGEPHVNILATLMRKEFC
jgi:hypothetical protein